jgi:hypothetical protein
MAETIDEQDIRALAEKLLFRLERHGARYTLTRKLDVGEPVRHDNVTLEEAREILNLWKLRGFHGG